MKGVVLLLGLAVVGCSTGHIGTTESAGTAAMSAPAHVVVTNFAITPDQVRLDSGVRAQFMRSQTDQPLSVSQMQAAEETQAALAETLASRLESYGLPVRRLPAAQVPPPGTLLVQGQIISIDEGNRTRRKLIGLGAGKSSIAADAQLYYIADPGHPHFVQSFTGSADSGHMPGAAETMGAGAAAQHIATSAALTGATHLGAEARRTDDEANADKLATALARQIGNFAVAQGWIPASAVH